MARKKKAPAPPPEPEILPAPALTTPTGQVIVPEGGEVVDPATASHVTLGDLMRNIRDRSDQLAAAKKLLVAEVLARMDRNAAWTMHAGKGVKLTAPSPRGEAHKGDNLHANLKPLVDAGVITQEAMDAAVREETEWKPMKGGIKKLLAAGDERVKRAIELSAEPDERPRNVRIEVEE